ncbi:hypothetical protein PSEUBRA_003394 [Kalmanozyma brasiliensis GHG001]|uniref:Uncharacterized protein n=1 Tax=Kalmanozyma brasiliensis (strain GHG001) TaxID=1365824 RepID=V5EVF6_KALBG|nr:uncharacterized protein PSEUBRA_003394 [Kalmanozyma brasiliensis GHG001]EST07223.1 hypothetical protein PSEUBRA_003394 [Kalmanozyma brasiliensis GHG001]
MTGLGETMAHSEGTVIQYDDPHPAGRDRRGVLIRSLGNAPAVGWKQLMSMFHTVWFALNPNVIRYRMSPALKPQQWKYVQVQLETAFCAAFPGKKLPRVHLFENQQGYRHIDIETPYDNVHADDIVQAALEQGWKVGKIPIGLPLCVGLPTSDLLFPVKLDNIPLNHVDEFITSLPSFFAQFNDASISLRIVDVWQMEGSVSMKASDEPIWLYAQSLVVLVEFTAPLPGSGRFYDLVHYWPAWVLWRNKVNVHLFFPGKFESANSASGRRSSLTSVICLPNAHD